ncbi:hypothetical protein EMPS_01130 [Entomortierella parvispora]|uniref:GAR domain-containing protein n=1 Tax=Entomortierella parvispora TaxID=205924 RepID=A0A9P3LSE1_9FUNG|nr:hypothetical protein EMPS_01130 [Entomortierella parvispora]
MATLVSSPPISSSLLFQEPSTTPTPSPSISASTSMATVIASAEPSKPTTTTVSPPNSTPATTGLYESYHSQLENLKRLPVPYSDIYHALSSHETIPLQTLHERFRGAASDLRTWLETAEMAVFALSMDVGQEGATDKRDVGAIDVIMNRFQPNVDMLVELKERIESRIKTDAAASPGTPDPASSEVEHDLQQTTQSIMSSWSSLKQMLEKVKGDLAGARLRGELLTHMDNVLQDIQDICTSIDNYNNERSAMTSDEEGLLPSGHHKPGSQVEAEAKQRSLDTLAQVDSRIELLISRIDFLDNRVGSLPTSDDSTLGNESKDQLQSRYQQVLSLWDDLKFRRERVSEELKEDKWLEVFEQVAEQVESMMESMERAIVHCQGLLDQIKGMVRQKVVPDAPIDRDHLYSIFQSFEAKQKYYSPAVNKMLDMLESGIESRMTRNMDVVSRHQAMNLKWDQLQDGLERVDMELDGVERMLDILDDSRTPYLPKLPLKKQEAPAKKTPAKPTPAGWRSSTAIAPLTPIQSRQKQQQQQQQQQMQRGRRPPSTSLRSPSPSPGRSRTRSPLNGHSQSQYRPWSPATSNGSVSRSPMLTASALNNYRSLSPSPERSPSRRSRPWCPSVSVSSPGIPGIPQVLSAAATYIPRPTSIMGQYQDEPAGYRGSTPSGLKSPAQYKPVFSPAGSNSKLSTGIRGGESTPGTTASRRQSQLPTPSSRSSSTQRGSSGLSPSPQLQRPGSRGNTPNASREAGSPIPRNYAASPTTPNSRLPTSALSGRQRQFSANGSVSSSGYGQQQNHYDSHGRGSPASSAHTTPRQGHHSGYFDDRGQQHSRPSSTLYGSRPGSASGSTSSLSRDSYHYGGYDEPGSPTTSTSSIGSLARQRDLQREQYLQQQRQQQQQSHSRYQSPVPTNRQPMVTSPPPSKSRQLPEMMEKIQIEEIEPYRPAMNDELDEQFARVVNASPIQMKVQRLGEGKYYFGGRMVEQPGGSLTMTGGKVVLCRLMEYGRIVSSTAGSQSGTGDDSGVSSGGSHSGSTDDGLQNPPQPNNRPPSSLSSASSAQMDPKRNGGPLATIYSSGSLAALQKAEAETSSKKRQSKVMVRVGGGWQDLDIFLLDHSFLANESVVVRAV